MAVSPTPSLSAADTAHIDARLAATDRLLDRNYPGDDGSRQPVHTVYVPADRFTPSFAADWGAQALTTAAAHGGLERLGRLLGQDAELAGAVASRVQAKLDSEPIE
ncbi:MAG TPA: aldolase, partial [Arthrobacter sp.]